ncbi:hypothetical protein O988_09177 [Pseudogymnoascus sp. VKM F-3808]|nr:hypothetical protein O988_09177 [Pseudogymnoascus sp. VKM F-3808]
MRVEINAPDCLSALILGRKRKHGSEPALRWQRDTVRIREQDGGLAPCIARHHSLRWTVLGDHTPTPPLSACEQGYWLKARAERFLACRSYNSLECIRRVRRCLYGAVSGCDCWPLVDEMPTAVGRSARKSGVPRSEESTNARGDRVSDLTGLISNNSDSEAQPATFTASINKARGACKRPILLRPEPAFPQFESRGPGARATCHATATRRDTAQHPYLSSPREALSQRHSVSNVCLCPQRESDQQRAAANHSTVHRVPSVLSRAQPAVLNFVDSAHRQHQPIEDPQKTRLANLTPPVTSRFTPLPQQTLSLKVGIENPPEPVGFALGLPCAEELHCPPVAHCSPRTVGLLPAYSSMHDAWHANPIIKQPEALLNTVGGGGRTFAIATISSHLNLNRDHRSDQIRATNHRISLVSTHTFGNEEHTTDTVAALVFVRYSGKSPALRKSTYGGCLAAFQDTPQNGSLPCKIEYVGYDPATRAQLLRKKQNGNFTRTGCAAQHTKPGSQSSQTPRPLPLPAKKQKRRRPQINRSLGTPPLPECGRAHMDGGTAETQEPKRGRARARGGRDWVCNARFPHHEVAGMFWRWGVGLRSVALRLYVTSFTSPPPLRWRDANRWAYQTLVHLLGTIGIRTVQDNIPDSGYSAVYAENVPPVRFCATDGDAQKPNIAHASSAVMYTLRAPR